MFAHALEIASQGIKTRALERVWCWREDAVFGDGETEGGAEGGDLG